MMRKRYYAARFACWELHLFLDTHPNNKEAARRLEQAAQRALELTGEGFGPTAAAKAAAQGTPYSKSEVYKQLLVLQQGQQAGE